MAMVMSQLRRRVLRRMGFRITNYETLDYQNRLLDIFEYLQDLYRKVEDVDGCVVECGYGYGMSFLALSKLAANDDSEILGYDSFMGFPEPSEMDVSDRQPKKGEWNHRTRAEAFRQIMNFGLNPTWTNSKVKLIEGFVETSLITDPPPNQIKFLHIDLDLYSAYQSALQNLWPLVANGGIVVFDEYNETKWPGATSAINEFFNQLPYEIERHRSGKYFVRKSSQT